MSFRERPEYKDWRDAVFGLFGRKCIRCGYAGNIHAHHVMPVEDYPELAFEPTNGVPLCGNCHVALKGDEMAHADDLKRLQSAIVTGEPIKAVGVMQSESVLQERAFADPTDSEHVEAWLEATNDFQAVADFYDRNRRNLAPTGALCIALAWKMYELERCDMLDLAETAIVHSEREGNLENRMQQLAYIKTYALDELKRYSESAKFLRDVLITIPNSARVHRRLSGTLRQVFAEDVENTTVLDECLHHALEAVELEPDEFQYAWWVADVLMSRAEAAEYEISDRPKALRDLATKEYCASALRYSKRALALASTNKEKLLALSAIAHVYYNNGLYADSRSFVRHALQIDECNVDVLCNIAACYAKEGGYKEAIRAIKQALMLAPRDGWLTIALKDYETGGGGMIETRW